MVPPRNIDPSVPKQQVVSSLENKQGITGIQILSGESPSDAKVSVLAHTARTESSLAFGPSVLIRACKAPLRHL